MPKPAAALTGKKTLHRRPAQGCMPEAAGIVWLDNGLTIVMRASSLLARCEHMIP